MSVSKRTLIIMFAFMVLMGSLSADVAMAGMAEEPINMEKLSSQDRDREILRFGIIAELDAINLYEQLAASATDPLIKKIMLDVAGEEKTHVGEFQALLIKMDEEHGRELEKGREEVEELTGNLERRKGDVR